MAASAYSVLSQINNNKDDYSRSDCDNKIMRQQITRKNIASSRRGNNVKSGQYQRPFPFIGKIPPFLENKRESQPNIDNNKNGTVDETSLASENDASTSAERESSSNHDDTSQTNESFHTFHFPVERLDSVGTIANAQQQLRLQRQSVANDHHFPFPPNSPTSRIRSNPSSRRSSFVLRPGTPTTPVNIPRRTTTSRFFGSLFRRHPTSAANMNQDAEMGGESIRARLNRINNSNANNNINNSASRRRSSSNSSRLSRYGAAKWMHEIFPFIGVLIGRQEWLFLILLGVLTAILSFTVDIIIDVVLRTRLTLFDEAQNKLLKLAIWVLPSVTFIMASTAITYNLAPQAIGSGIAHLKTILHGVVLKEYLSLRTLWVKLVGLTLALCSGLPLGKVGPFVHIGAIMARQLGRVREHLISDWRTKTALPGVASRKYDTVGAGCAVGLASCDASPVGGVLFAIEVTSTHFAIQNYWRGFLAALSAALSFRLLSVWFQDELTLLPLFSTKFPIEFPFDMTELMLFILLGATCGILGALYVKLHRQVSLLHRRVPKRHRTKFVYLFPFVFAILYTALTFPDGFGNYLVGRLWLRKAAMEFFYDSHAGTNTYNGMSVLPTVHGGDYVAIPTGPQHYSSVYSPTLGMFLTTYNTQQHGSNTGGVAHRRDLSTKDGINFDSTDNETPMKLDPAVEKPEQQQRPGTFHGDETPPLSQISATPFDDIRFHIEKFQPGASVIFILCNYCIAHFFLTTISVTLPVPNGVFVPTMVIGGAFGRLMGEVVALCFPHGFSPAGHRATGGGDQLMVDDTTSRVGVTPVLPGAYSVVGAAAFVAGVTQTISPAIIAVELTGQVGHIIPLLMAVLVANAVAKRIDVSIYESIINLLRLPYVPHLDVSNEAVHRTTVADIMICFDDVRFVTFDATYGQVRILLAKTASKITVFPLVDSKSTMVLIGAVLRSDLQACIDSKLSFRNYLNHLTAPEADEDVDAVQDNDFVQSGIYQNLKKKKSKKFHNSRRSEQSKFTDAICHSGYNRREHKLNNNRQKLSSSSKIVSKSLDDKNDDKSERLPVRQQQRRRNSLLIQPVSTSNNKSDNTQQAKGVPTTTTNRKFSSATLTRAATAETLYAGNKFTNATPTTTTEQQQQQPTTILTHVNNQMTTERSLLQSRQPSDNSSDKSGMSAKRAVSVNKLDTRAQQDTDYYKTISSSSPTSFLPATLPAGDEVLSRLAWEEKVLARKFDFSQCKVDISPMQVAETMPLAKVHLVFSLLSVNIVYVTSLGRLVGIATVSDLRRALQSSVK